MRLLLKRVEALEAFSTRLDDQPPYLLLTVVDASHRRDPEDTEPAPAGAWSTDEVKAAGVTVPRLPGEPDPVFHARAAKLVRRADPSMVPVLMPVWRPLLASA